MLLSAYVEVIVFNANIVKCASFQSLKAFVIVVLKHDKTIWLHIRHKYLGGWSRGSVSGDLLSFINEDQLGLTD